MNYLLFVYYDNTVENSEEKTNQIAAQISDVMTSKEIKFMFGDKHAIFHFATDLSLTEMGELLNIISFEIEGFEFFLTHKTKNNFSNFPQDNLDHLLSLKKTIKKSNVGMRNHLIDFTDLIMNLKKVEVCNLTLDELLDKMVDKGIDSLSEIERNKLEEYSKSI